MRQHRVIRRERAQDVAGEEHAGNVRWVANSDTRLPTVTSETRNPWAMSGKMPTTTNSLIPSTKLDAISVTTGSVKKRSLPLPPTDGGTGHDHTPAVFSSSRRNIH